MSKDKLDRKEIKKPDEFVSQGRSIFEHLIESRRRWMPALLGLLIVVAGYYAYKYFVTTRQNKAWSELQKIELNEKEDEKISQLEKFANESLSTRAQFLAAVRVADYAYGKAEGNDKELSAEKRLEQAKNAVNWYSKAITFSGLSLMEKQLLLLNQGQAHELSNDLDSALIAYEQASTYGGNVKAMALLNLGRVYELKNELNKAKDAYQNVVNDYATTDYGKRAKGFIRAIDSPLIKPLKSSSN